jgi:integral membrane protein
MLSFFRIVAILEGISYLALFVISMPLKYLAGMGEPNKFIGYAHGGLFLLYIVIAMMFAMERKWNSRKMIWLIVAALLPFGTFYLEEKVLKPLAVKKALDS